MRFLIFIVVWVILLLLCWPLALLILVAAPVLWLLSLPFRLLGICVEATFSLVRAVLLLPSRLLGGRART